MDDLDLGATIKGFSPGQKVFGRYTLKKILGRGGMGVVWLAQDGELEREVALKFLPEIVALDPEALADLKRETRRNLDLTHPHIVRIYDFVADSRTAAISMEYVNGASLSALKLDKPGRVFTTEEIRGWLGQLTEALTYAHTKAKVVHRDLKPANLMLTKDGDLKITDFGIARGISDSVSRVSAQAGGSSGTPVYMSPQQMMGEKPAVTDDIYALGATLYELLTGKPPFYSGNVFMQVQNKLPPPIAERRQELEVTSDPVPDHWEQTIAACLAKEPAERPQSGAELLRRLGGESVPPATRSVSPSSVVRPVPVTSLPAVDRPTPGAGLHWARRWLLAPIVGALPTTFVMSMCVAGMIQVHKPDRQADASIFPFIWVGSTLLGAGIFLLLIAIRRPWRFRGSWGVVVLGAFTGGTIAAIFTVTHELGAALSLGGTALGAAVGALSAWWLYRVAARATFLPSGPIPGLRPGYVYCAQAILLLVATQFFSIRIPEAAKAAEDMRSEQVRAAHLAEWTPKIDEAYRLVFDREPTAVERQRYVQRMEYNPRWAGEDLRREMRDSEEGRNGGRLRVPEEFKKIQDAILAAKPGNVVVVAPGTYEERLFIGSGITLQGAGRDQVLVQASASSTVLQISTTAAGVKVSGITFRHVAGAEKNDGYPAVYLAGRDLEFTGNAVTDSLSHGIATQGAVNFTIRDCVVTGSAWDGIAVSGGSGGRIERNQLSRNRQRGLVLIEATRDLTISHNTIQDNPDCGLLVLKGDGVVIAGNTLTGNGSRSSGGGIFVDKGAGRPVLRGNIARDNKGAGIGWAREAEVPVLEAGNLSDGREVTAPGAAVAAPPASAAPAKKIYVARDVDPQPQPLAPIEPVYPPAMVRAGLGGSVELEYVVNQDGLVENITVISSTRSEFVAAALDAIKQARFRPAQLKGEAVSVRARQIFNFKIPQ